MAAAIPESQLADAVGPPGLPRIYAVVLGWAVRSSCSGSLVRRGASQGIVAGPGSAGGPPVMLMIGVVYIAVVPWLGYVLSHRRV